MDGRKSFNAFGVEEKGCRTIKKCCLVTIAGQVKNSGTNTGHSTVTPNGPQHVESLITLRLLLEQLLAYDF
jgi:hypothetical protein